MQTPKVKGVKIQVQDWGKRKQAGVFTQIYQYKKTSKA